MTGRFHPGLEPLLTILAEIIAEELIEAEQLSAEAPDAEPARAVDRSPKQPKSEKTRR